MPSDMDFGPISVASLTMKPASFPSSPSPGRGGFDGIVSYLAGQGGMAQVLDAFQCCLLGTDFNLTNGTAAQQALNGSPNGAITLPVGNYLFESQYYITNTGITSHFWEVLFGGTAVLSNIGYSIVGNTLTAAGAGTGNFAGYANAATVFQATPASTSATENAVISLYGVFVVSTAGTLIPQVQLSAAPGGAQKMKAGSFFLITSMPTAAVVGAWS